MNCQRQLDEWFKEDFGIDNMYVEFVGYVALDSHVSGLCTGYSDKTSKIKVTSKFANKDNYTTAVLWHEYCHSYTWYTNHNMNHNLDFYRKQLSKPGLFLMDVVSAFAFIFQRDKR